MLCMNVIDPCLYFPIISQDLFIAKIIMYLLPYIPVPNTNGGIGSRYLGSKLDYVRSINVSSYQVTIQHKPVACRMKLKHDKIISSCLISSQIVCKPMKNIFAYRIS